MHRLCSIFIILLTVLSIKAEDTPTTLQEWADRFETFGANVPQEEIFIHMDNSNYFLGDTIFFKAYVRTSNNNRPSNISGLLYVELLNQDGYLVERQRIKLTNGQGRGSVALLDTLYGGYYELRAYTRWQLNWGEYQHPHTKFAEEWFYDKKMAYRYFRDYDKLYSRVFPVYDKPQVPGDYFRDMTVRPLQRYFRAEKTEPKAELTFYPEGGNLVAGATCRVAFEANSEEGKHLKGTVIIRDKEQNVVAKANTENRGRGTFLLDCKADEKYQATFDWEGNTSDQEELPEVIEDGVAIQAEVTNSTIHIALEARGKAATEELGLTASCHGMLKDFQQLGIHSSTTADIDLAKLPTGVIQLSVFNAEGRLYADRLIFVRQSGFKPQTITFSGIKAREYKAFDPIDIKVKGDASGTISVAVREAAHSDYTFDSGNILTEMLLSSQIKGFVEQPEYFFERNDEKHRRALDLLLMVQGWRRYNWTLMATPGAFELQYNSERTEMLTGEVNPYTAIEQEDPFRELGRQMMAEAGMDADSEAAAARNKHTNQQAQLSGIETTAMDNQDSYNEMLNQMKNWNGSREKINHGDHSVSAERFYANEGRLKHEVLVHAEFVQMYDDNTTEGAEGDVSTYNKGLFRISSPHYYGSLYLQLSASDSTKWKPGKRHSWIQYGEDKSENINYPEYYVKLNPIYPRFVKPYSYYQSNEFEMTHHTRQSRVNVDDARVTTLNEVVIGAKRGGLRKFDVTKPAFVIDAYDAFNDVCDAGLCTGYFIGANHFVRDVARTYIGDMNMERNYDLIIRYNGRNTTYYITPQMKEKYNHLSNLDKVYIYTDYSPRREGDKHFSQSNQPTVTIGLNRYEDDSKRITYRDRRYIMSGFNICEDFYNPDYSKKPLPETKDYRRTLYWNPDLQLDDKGQANIQLYNNSSESEIIISAEGMTADGTPLTGISYPEDR